MRHAADASAKRERRPRAHAPARASASAMQRVGRAASGSAVDGARRRPCRRAGRRSRRATPGGAQRLPGPRHERRGRALEHRAADDRADGDDRRRRGAQRLGACPGTARIGRDRDDRVRRADDDRAARRRSPRAPRRRARAASTPASSTPSTGPSPRSRIMNSWKAHPARRAARTRVRTGSSAIGSTRARTPSAAPSSRERLGQPRALAQPLARGAGTIARSRSPRLNQTSTPSSRSASITWNVSPRRPQPRSSMRSASQNVHEVGVGRDVGAVDLDVVAGVGDRRRGRRRRRRASRARASRRRCRRRGRPPSALVRQPGDADPGVRLVAAR